MVEPEMTVTTRADRLAVAGNRSGAFTEQIRAAMLVKARYVMDGGGTPSPEERAFAARVLDDSRYFAGRFADLAVFDVKFNAYTSAGEFEAITDTDAESVVGAVWPAFVR